MSKLLWWLVFLVPGWFLINAALYADRWQHRREWPGIAQMSPSQGITDAVCWKWGDGWKRVPCEEK